MNAHDALEVARVGMRDQLLSTLKSEEYDEDVAFELYVSYERLCSQILDAQPAGKLRRVQFLGWDSRDPAYAEHNRTMVGRASHLRRRSEACR